MAEDAGAGMTPLLHLDMHGSRDDGLAIESAGESIRWPILADALRQINAVSRNNLCVLSRVCFSFCAVSQSGVDILAAVTECFGDRMRYFHCEEMFANVLYAYFDERPLERAREPGSRAE